MKMLQELLKLLILLIAIAAIGYGVWRLQGGHDRTKKYAHPISRPGAGW